MGDGLKRGRAAALKPRVRRDGTVVLDGEVIGRVYGEPRNWCFALADYREPLKTAVTGWFSKQEAAGMCARAHRETPKREA